MRTKAQSELKFNISLSKPKRHLELYGVVLGGGNGKRMEEFVFHHLGSAPPKQFVAFTGRRSMIQHTIDRVTSIIPKENILIVVDATHHQEVQSQLGDLSPDTILYQPFNRETAPGIMLPLTKLYTKDPNGIIAVFPSDHFILEETRFMEYVLLAKRVIEIYPDQVALLGMEPDGPEPDFGWIQPGETLFGLDEVDIRKVERFHEKPDPKSAHYFFNQSYLWNTMVVVARCSTLWKLFRKALPHIQDHFDKIYRAVDTPTEEKVIFREYQEMGSATFSHAVLERFSSQLIVINVRDVFWSDWGSGHRVVKTLNQIGRTVNVKRGLSIVEEKTAAGR